jgi:hypothetical protein
MGRLAHLVERKGGSTPPEKESPILPDVIDAYLVNARAWGGLLGVGFVDCVDVFLLRRGSVRLGYAQSGVGLFKPGCE